MYYWQDTSRRDGRAYGRGARLLTIFSEVSVLESYRTLIDGYGWVNPNGFDLPLNTQIFVVLSIADDGRGTVIDWLEPGHNG